MNKFNKIAVGVQSRSPQNLSKTFHGSHDFGRMDVVYCNSDIVAGDDIDLDINGYLRGAPMPAPTFGQVDVDVRVFFVPHRIATSRPSEVGENGFSWDNYISGVSSNSHPYATARDLLIQFNAWLYQDGTERNPMHLDFLRRDCRRLMSQLGVPASIYNNIGTSPSDFPSNLYNQRVSNLWKFHAYQRVWWDYYRDSSLIEESYIRNYVPLLHSGRCTGVDYFSYFEPRYACFRKDYFTTAKQYPEQGGFPVVAPTAGRNGISDFVTYDPNNVIDPLSDKLDPTIKIDSVSASTLPIQWLRAANALQKYLERNNLAGTRLMERFLARFGVTPSSVALDMSEYLGGSRTTLSIGDVTANNEEFNASFIPSNAFNTASVDGSSTGTIQGQLGGKSSANCRSGHIKFHAKEYGTLIAIQTLIPHVSYYQGLSRMDTRGTDNDRFEYFTPEFENIGYQPLYGRELVDSLDTYGRVFGYVPRYQDYKFDKDVVCGDLTLKETSAGMDSWHLARQFTAEDLSSEPEVAWLTPAFTMITPQERVKLDRIFSIPGTIENQLDHFTSVIHSEVHIVRPMSSSALPSLDEDISQDGKRIELQNGGVRF